jgi:hypothetical protein
MNREHFLNDGEVGAFVTWFAENAANLCVNLDIRSSKHIPGGIKSTAHGLDGVINSYYWRACWFRQNGQPVGSGCWASTVASLGLLRQMLKSALNDKSDKDTMQACCAIFAWGGERNTRVGARPFLEGKKERSELAHYLTCTRNAFSLGNANLDNLGAIECVNSMLTKVYAFAADDGLPIYDSRVAAAIACLVELFRASTDRSWNQIPPLLSFPAVGGTDRRRRVLRLDAKALDPGMLSYVKNDTARLWASAKVRLGWIMKAVLDKPQKLLEAQNSRMHAFEASLFMIGYDVQCLSGNLDSPDLNES